MDFQIIFDKRIFYCIFFCCGWKFSSTLLKCNYLTKFNGIQNASFSITIVLVRFFFLFQTEHCYCYSCDFMFNEYSELRVPLRSNNLHVLDVDFGRLLLLIRNWQQCLLFEFFFFLALGFQIYIYVWFIHSASSFVIQ